MTPADGHWAVGACRAQPLPDRAVTSAASEPNAGSIRCRASGPRIVPVGSKPTVRPGRFTPRIYANEIRAVAEHC